MSTIEDDKVYIRFRGRTLGPLTTDKVRELVKRGQVTRMHELSADGLSWLKAEEFGDFFRGSAAAVTEKNSTNQPTAQGASDDVDNAFQSAGVLDGELGDEWYAHVNGENKGPVPFAQMQKWKHTGAIQRDTLVWRAGLEAWQPAEEAIPTLFPRQFYNSPAVGNSYKATGGQGQTALETFANDLNRRRGWIMLIGVVLIVFSSLAIIGYIFLMIAAGGQPNAAFVIIWAILGIATSGAFMAAGLMLVQYCGELRAFGVQPNAETAQRASKRHNDFWTFTGIVCLASIVLSVCFMLVAFFLGVAAASLAFAV